MNVFEGRMSRILIVFLCFFYSVNLFAQDLDNSFSAKFEQDSVLLKAGKAFSNGILLKNNSDIPVRIDSIKAAEQYPGLLYPFLWLLFFSFHLTHPTP